MFAVYQRKKRKLVSRLMKKVTLVPAMIQIRRLMNVVLLTYVDIM